MNLFWTLSIDATINKPQILGSKTVWSSKSLFGVFTVECTQTTLVGEHNTFSKSLMIKGEWKEYNVTLNQTLYSGYNIRILATRMLKISVKSGTRYDYFDPNVEWVADEWSHLSATWTVGHGIRAYLNGCDMDADDIKGYASAVTRSEPVSTSLPFQLGYSGGWDAAVGTTIDELFVWDGLLNSYQILELYMQGGTMWLKVLPVAMGKGCRFKSRN